MLGVRQLCEHNSVLFGIENYARIFGENTEPVDYYTTVLC